MCFESTGNQLEVCKSVVHELETVGLFTTFIYASALNDKTIVLLKPNVSKVFQYPVEFFLSKIYPCDVQMVKVKKFADLIQFKIEMNPEYLRSKIKNGVRYKEDGKRGERGDYKIAPRNINENITVMKPFDHSKFVAFLTLESENVSNCCEIDVTS